MAAMLYPVGTATNASGHLEIGGCDVVELAAEYGTPAYVFAAVSYTHLTLPTIYSV